MIEGYGSFGVVYSSPRVPFTKKYKFNTNINKMVIFNLEDHLVNEVETNNDEILYNEVSKIFFEEKEYRAEVVNYINIIKKYNIDEQYFNLPLNFGGFNEEFTQNNKFECFKKMDYENNTQITFKRGTKILLNNLNIIISKFNNIILALKYLNENHFLFDDIKYDNMLDVGGLFKLSDFSSLTKFRKLDYKKFKDDKLSTLVYHIYNPIFNNIIYLLLSKRSAAFSYIKYSVDKLISNLVNDSDWNKYYNYSFKILDNLINLCKKIYCNDTTILLKIKCFDLNNVEYELDIGIYDIIDNIFFFLDSKNNDLDKKIYRKNKNLLIYYNNKYKSNIENIKYDILKRINIYSLGISLLYILGEKINEKSDFDLKLLLEITILCLLSIFEFNGNFYYNDIDINEIYKKYESMISLHHDSIEIMSKSSSDDSLFPELNTSGNK